MMKYSIAAKVAHTELKKALDGMLKVLKNLNDSLHVVGLKDFPVSCYITNCYLLPLTFNKSNIYELFIVY